MLFALKVKVNSKKSLKLKKAKMRKINIFACCISFINKIRDLFKLRSR